MPLRISLQRQVGNGIRNPNKTAARPTSAGSTGPFLQGPLRFVSECRLARDKQSHFGPAQHLRTFFIFQLLVAPLLSSLTNESTVPFST
ncbi:lipase serine [Cordyceps militaris]|uniref:Lipase serine n=1 Tax=Cordyceps militaris TaxID=73501 RepID=A0A2H4SS63_CORMI|nr:lipase serine [Cordyceps militaris]